MSIDLKLVEEFQRRFGVEECFARARDLMFAYVSLIQRPLPPLGADALKVAKRMREGTSTSEEREQARMAIWDYISDSKAWSDTSPEYCIIRVVTMFLNTDTGRDIDSVAEDLRVTFWMVNKFEDHSDSVAQLIQQFFPSIDNNKL